MTRQPDLLSALHAPCGTCRHMTGPALASGVRYCARWATWQAAADRIDCRANGCERGPCPMEFIG